MSVPLLWQLAFAAVVLIAACAVRSRSRGRLGAWHRFTGGIARQKALADLLCGGIAVSIAAALSWVSLPQPRVHDEYAYLLAADTFVHGRLANPMHPLWEHFETFHTLMQPTYSSKFPPGPGLMLALGQWLGHPVLGVILSCGLAVAAACWMLRGWLPARWALLGGVLVAVNPWLQLHWGHSYWGGFLPLLGGCLLFGGIPRFVRSQHIRDALAIAAGISILATTRQFEGLLATSIGAAIFAIEARRVGLSFGAVLKRGVLPGLPVIALTLIFLACHNQAVTRSWRTLPYQLHTQQYSPWLPLLLPQPFGEGSVTFRHRVFDHFYGIMRGEVELQKTFAGWIGFKGPLVLLHWRDVLGIALTIPCLALPWIFRRGSNQILAIAATVYCLGVLLVSFFQLHYFAPGMPILLILLFQSFRVMRASPLFCGRFAVSGIVVLYLAVCGWTYWKQAGPEPLWARHALQQRLTSMAGKHLVVVRYSDQHDSFQEWVYNSADIDGSKVVWAREMDAEHNRKLVEYFPDRTVWLVLADAHPPKVIRDPRARRQQDSPHDGEQQVERTAAMMPASGQ